MIKIAFFLLLAPLIAVAQPKAQTVVSGTATFSQPPTGVTITNTPNSIINWSSFSVGKDAAPTSLQPLPGPQLNQVPQGGMAVPIPGVLLMVPAMPTTPTMSTTPAVHVQPPVAAPASASQAVQLPDGRIVFRTTQQ